MSNSIALPLKYAVGLFHIPLLVKHLSKYGAAGERRVGHLHLEEKNPPTAFQLGPRADPLVCVRRDSSKTRRPLEYTSGVSRQRPQANSAGQGLILTVAQKVKDGLLFQLLLGWHKPPIAGPFPDASKYKKPLQRKLRRMGFLRSLLNAGSCHQAWKECRYDRECGVFFCFFFWLCYDAAGGKGH